MAREGCHEALRDPDAEEEEALLELKLMLFSFLGFNVNSVNDLLDYTLTGKACSAIGFLCRSPSVVI